MKRSRTAAEDLLLPFLLPWLAALSVDVYLAFSGWPRPPAWQLAIDIGVFGLAGRVQWRFARGWGRSPLLAAAVVVWFAFLIYGPRPMYQLIPFLLGLAIGVAWLLRQVAMRWPASPVLGAVIAILAVLGTRWLEGPLRDRPATWTSPSVLADLCWPLHRLSASASAASGPVVVVLSVDTLRADAARAMATFTRLAARGAAWERAMSTSSWTLPALASLQTGRMPAEHGAGCLEDGHCQGIFPKVHVLAEELRGAGYATAAIVSNPWISPGTGFGRGFETFVEQGNPPNRLILAGLPAGPHPQDAKHTVDAALRWLETAPERGFYLWVHFLGPHLPYTHSGDPSLRSLEGVRLRSAFPLSAARRTAIRAAYAAEVAYTDAQLQRLLDALERRGILDQGVVVFTADHGEEFWDHLGVEHGHSHHGEVVDVPLVLVAPGVTAGARSGVASLIDVAPTIRAAVGLPPGGIDLRRGVPEGRIATAWGGLVQHLDCSARDASRRVIAVGCDHATAAVSAYDLGGDPAELHPIAWTPDDELVRAAWSVAPPRPGTASEIDRSALRALGYVQ
jgi:arylsulfatase